MKKFLKILCWSLLTRCVSARMLLRAGDDSTQRTRERFRLEAQKTVVDSACPKRSASVQTRADEMRRKYVKPQRTNARPQIIPNAVVPTEGFATKNEAATFLRVCTKTIDRLI